MLTLAEMFNLSLTWIITVQQGFVSIDVFDIYGHVGIIVSKVL